MTDQTHVIRRPGKRPNGSGRDPVRAVRVATNLWTDAKTTAHAEGITLGHVIRCALEDYVAGTWKPR